MKNLVKVEILGREYTVKSDEEEERVQKIADYVNRKMKEVLQRVKTVSTLNVAILAAMNIASDYLDSEEAQRMIGRVIEAKSSRLIEMIDSQIN
jgi:cell division protein ZapA